MRILLLFFIKFQISRLERKLAEVEEQLHSEMTAKDELESAHRTTSVKLAKLTEELSEEVGFWLWKRLGLQRSSFHSENDLNSIDGFNLLKFAEIVLTFRNLRVNKILSKIKSISVSKFSSSNLTFDVLRPNMS